MRFDTQNSPPKMTLTASSPSEAHTLCQAFGLLEEGDSITLTRKNTATEKNPDAFEVSYSAPRTKKPKKKTGSDK